MCEMCPADVDIDSFLRDQEILEADAREALPYVRLPTPRLYIPLYTQI